MSTLIERGKIIRRKRDDLGWTQTEVATRAGVSLSYIQKLEGGREDAGFKPSSLRAVSIALGFDPEYLRSIVRSSLDADAGTDPHKAKIDTVWAELSEQDKIEIAELATARAKKPSIKSTKSKR